ncbi:hypothetical protein GCM10007231_23440 [Nocardioides daphniae]|uniref:Uncharacterized protein n=1 Tax=Nocardioides daphniae TaxID=402297 RepID=A0ABQ1QF69_9ACTN|nr:hypothetical protein GCM10007231_23440 [Nocardioides daphniae]
MHQGPTGREGGRALTAHLAKPAGHDPRIKGRERWAGLHNNYDPPARVLRPDSAKPQLFS